MMLSMAHEQMMGLEWTKIKVLACNEDSVFKSLLVLKQIAKLRFSEMDNNW